MSTPTAFAPTQEMRFAVVMYGGVSLAIYINGVAQGLLQLVRATAPATTRGATLALHSDAELAGTTAAVYRDAARRLSHGKRVDLRESLEGLPIRTRFVVDVISGTSAGGINGVYLAKALTNDQPIDRLKDLWVEEGNIAKLIDAAVSYEDLSGLRRIRPPRALLNGRRMYWKLLAALDDMDAAPRQANWESPLVDELDLWITTTDLRGLTVPIDLYDRLVFERRHRKVFRFLYRRGLTEGQPAESQFTLAHNPMLAFAARCTSSFPFAFEPVQLGDVDQALRAERFRARYGTLTSDHPSWRPLFSEYLPRGDDTPQSDPSYLTQSFADGGYLDNKPFSWPTESLELRTAERPVDRRLIYIEPDPGSPRVALHPPGLQGQHPPDLGPLAHLDPELARTRPDAIENAVAAMSGIPRYEPIREDLEHIVRRNREVDRLLELTRVLDDADDLSELDIEQWRSQPIDATMQDRGTQYVAYQRLRVAATGDDLASLLTRLSGYDDESDAYSAIRCLVQAWIDRHFPRAGVDDASQCEFLLRYDFGYRVRRLDFLQRRADEEIARSDTVEGLLAFKAALSDSLAGLRATGRALRERAGDNPVAGEVDVLALGQDELLAILNGALSKEESEERAGALLDGDPNRHGTLTTAMGVIQTALETPFATARSDLRDALQSLPAGDACDRLSGVFARYELYDSIHYPIAYRSVGEADRVEVVRISPLDAGSIVSEPADQRRKLAGTTLHHFGGFFDASWRRNDILWGRLDAAECILTSLVGPTLLRDDLLRDAQRAIIREELLEGARDEVIEGLVQTLLARGESPETGELARQALEAASTPDAVLDEMSAAGYVRERRLDPQTTLDVAGRMVTATGEVLGGIAAAPAAKRAARVAAVLGRFLIGFVEMATRRSVIGIAARWWAQLLLVVAVVMIVGGALVGLPEAASAGWILAVAVAGVKIATWVTAAYIGGGGLLRRVARSLVVVGVALAIACVAWAAIAAGRVASDRFNDWACDLPDPLPRMTQDAWPLGDSRCGR